MTTAALVRDDVPWAVQVLARRRASLVPHAPVFWRAAADADARHREYVAELLAAGARGYRTASSVLVAAPARQGWLVDNLAVAGAHADTEGRELWDAFAADCGGEDVRFVRPTYESARARLAADAGLGLSESWWLRELAGSGGGDAGVRVDLPGAEAITVGAPPVYDPPGPVLLLPTVDDAEIALPAALERAPDLGCAAVVVRQGADDGITARLDASGFRRHCDFYEGIVRPT